MHILSLNKGKSITAGLTSSTKASVAESNWASTELMELIKAMPHLEDLIYSLNTICLI